ncbi:MAG: DUF5977 domain-containing protein [Leadbetterella sp.]|nr:DUF5977 domain-containing protein [Leadbetterella sp.]
MIAADELSLGTPIGLDLVNNPVVVNVDPYELGTITDRNTIRYELDVMVFNGEEFLLAATLETYEEPAKVTGNSTSYRGAFFEIGGILKGFLAAELPFFGKAREAYLNVIFEVPEMTLQYYTVVRIYVDDVLEETIENSQRWAYKGAISEVDFERHGKSFFTKWIGDGRFIASAPFGRNGGPSDQGPALSQLSTGAGQVGFVSWLHNFAETILSIKLKVVGLYANGTEVVAYPLETMDVSPMGVYAVPVGGASVVAPLASAPLSQREGVETPGVADVPADGVKLVAEELVSYRCWLVDENDDRVSEVATISYDQAYHRNLRQLVYVNSLGVPTAVIATGQNAIGMEYARTEGESYRGFGYEANLTERRVDIVEGIRKFVFSLAYGKLSQMRQLVDVGFAKEIFLLDNNQWLPLVNVGKVMPIHDDADEWTGIVMEMEMGYKETAYSNLPVPEATEDRPTAWRPLTTVCDLDSRGRYYGMLKVLTVEKYYTDDDEPVRPAEVMKNKPGPNFFPLTPSSACVVGNTPHLQDVARSREGNFYNQTCGTGLVGGKATLTIPIGSWGSLLSMQDTYDKADAEIDILDTQAYANANGPCNSVGVYDPGTIDAGRWWLRAGDFSGSSEPSGIVAEDVGSGYVPGCMWFQLPEYQANQLDVRFGATRLNGDYPVLPSGRDYFFIPYYKAGKTLRFWRNGLLVGSTPIVGAFPSVVFPAEPASGEKWYIDAV